MMINAKARLMKEQNKRIELMIKNPEYTPADEVPPIVPKTYSAGEVGAMLGVSANKIGRLAVTAVDKTENRLIVMYYIGTTLVYWSNK